MPTELCPRCGGPCDDNVSNFQYYCSPCMLCFSITPEGRFSAAITLQPGKDWSDQPWIKRLAEKYPGLPQTLWTRIWIRVRDFFQMGWIGLMIAFKVKFHHP
jgi:hypothetical protein